MEDVQEGQHQRRLRQPRRQYKRNNYFEIYNNEEFCQRFRLTKTQTFEVLAQIEHRIVQVNKNDAAVTPTIQLLVTLRFYATACFLQVVSDFIGMCTTTAQIIVHRVSLAIVSELFHKYIKLPKREKEMLHVMTENFKISGMIRVIGSIDCVHVRIQSYGGDDAELWRCRKGFMSINVQCLVNSNLEIMDIVARWPGSTHDSTIFANSRLKQRFDNFECDNGVILGDRGYPNQRYLITPLANPTTPAEVLFNEAHIRTRCMVERCFGSWGRMFPVSSGKYGTRFQTPERTINVILASAILYNITRRDKRKIPQGLEPYLNIPETHEAPCTDDRQHLIEEYFSRLI
ncbi:putative nuclease HARBI1 [Prorops nasuta]|uniref:putative nuclease HARBI1 n=1 Tax=Prorops nasuta TaxID=863751 RepID=UPI0034CDF833